MLARIERAVLRGGTPGPEFERLAGLLAEAVRVLARAGTHALALAWVMSHPLVTAPNLGPRKPANLESARRTLNIRLTPDERLALGTLVAP